MIRLLKFVQQQAKISRRKSEALIKDGRVELNGEIVTHPFVEVDPGDVRELKVHGRQVSLQPEARRIYKFRKPQGMLSSHHDPHHGMTVGRVLEQQGLNGYAIAGRLDKDAEGLILLTNDGDLVNVLTHPSYEVEKRYRVIVPRTLSKRHVEEVFARMQKGVEDEGETLRIADGRLIETRPHEAEIEVALIEGKKREIKRLFKHFKLPVARLIRVAIGPVALGALKPNQLRPVSSKEERALDALKGRLGKS